MKTYELMYILSSGVTSEDAENVKKDVETFVQGKGGVVLKSQKTVPQVLAYPIKKNTSGYFITLEFQTEESTIKEINEKLVKDDKVLRHFMTIKRPVKIMKARRTRKPAILGHAVQGEGVMGQATAVGGVPSEGGKKVKELKPVELKDIEKKLDEILSE